MKQLVLATVFTVLQLLSGLITFAHEGFPKEPLIYKINLSGMNEEETLEKGSVLNAVLLDDVSIDGRNEHVNFYLPLENGADIRLKGIITRSNDGGRFAEYSMVQFSTDNLYLDDGREISINAVSPQFSALHPPHINSNLASIANAVTTFSLSASPVTLGASLGASFLVNGILSAKQNGISDFVWGGLNGTGLTFIEKMLRKQPDAFLSKGNYVPFVLSEDLKISKGVEAEKISKIQADNNDVIIKIKQLIEWGDLAGALEYSIKTGQKEIYENLLKEFGSNEKLADCTRTRS